MKKHGLLLLVALTAAAFMIGCGDGEDVIRIGVSGPYSGDLASYGIPSRNAAELVTEEWNQKGGLLGKQIRLVIEDDVCNPNVAPDVATKILGDNVAGVIGHICSGATEAALSVYVESELPVISPSATNPPLTQSGDYPNFFRTIAPDDAQAELQINFILNTLGLSRIAILHDRQSYGRGLAEFAQAYVQASANGEVVLMDGIQADAIDYSAVINRVVASGAEVLVYGGYHPEASKLVSQMQERGIDMVFVSCDGVKDNTFIEVAGSAAEGVFATGPNDTTQDPIAVQARNAHLAKWNEEPGAFFYNAYAATQALYSAIEKAGSTDPAAIKTALRSNFVTTPLGSISFDQKGDAVGVGFSMFQVQNGVYIEITVD